MADLHCRVNAEGREAAAIDESAMGVTICPDLDVKEQHGDAARHNVMSTHASARRGRDGADSIEKVIV
jgi:hypothetical protein